MLSNVAKLALVASFNGTAFRYDQTLTPFIQRTLADHLAAWFGGAVTHTSLTADQRRAAVEEVRAADPDELQALMDRVFTNDDDTWQLTDAWGTVVAELADACPDLALTA